MFPRQGSSVFCMSVLCGYVNKIQVSVNDHGGQKRALDCLGAEVIGGSESLDAGSGNCFQVLCKSSKCA